LNKKSHKIVFESLVPSDLYGHKIVSDIASLFGGIISSVPDSTEDRRIHSVIENSPLKMRILLLNA
jgi:hypothetical protein